MHHRSSVRRHRTCSAGVLLVRGAVAGICAAMMVGGCGKKPVGQGIVFDLDKVFTGRPSPALENWKEKGVRLAKDKNFGEAVEAFKNHVQEDPENFFGFNALAVSFKNMGDHSQAMKNYERALEFVDSAEERAKVLANIGNLYYSANKPQAALGYYKEAAAEFDKNPLYLVLIARTFVTLDEYDRARKVLTEAQKIHKNLDKYERDEDRGLGSYLMAYSYAALSEEEKVFTYLENALKTNPGKYVKRIEEDLSDEKSLLYTLKDDPRLQELLRKYSSYLPSIANRDGAAFLRNPLDNR
jgi:tetratricopeptide (TPR) repeat protein